MGPGELARLGEVPVSDQITTHAGRKALTAVPGKPLAVPAAWQGRYLQTVVAVDSACALVAGVLGALTVHSEHPGPNPAPYVVLTLSLPLLWCASVALARGYDVRIVGLGSDEFRRVFNAAVSLTAAIAIVSYATNSDIARGYVLVALPCATVLDLAARYALRKRLHRRRRRSGEFMRRVIAVGHAEGLTDLITELRREPHHGLTVVGACLTAGPARSQVAAVPVCGGLERVQSAVADLDADTVAVLACPELNGTRLRELAWQLEKTDTGLCVAPAVLDVAGPRTTIRPVAGMPLLHVDHPELTGLRWVIKGMFDRVCAAAALVMLAPLMAMIALAIRRGDGGPAVFRQTRVGKDGRPFMVCKFRTMVVDAEQRKAALLAHSEGNGVLFKMRSDPRITPVGARLRKYSLDELPQLWNVLKGDMSLVGPRPALPAEADLYGDYVRRRLVVKPGITGLWQVSGRSDLPWEEAVRLDLRYVENWSLALDVQILWKTWAAVLKGSGAY
jgi:exopolysaccharide biosynthesis polyprenyl glycosylphosphotransferase